MSNQAMNGQPPQQPDTAGLIRPEQVLQVPVNLDDGTRQKYYNGVVQLWNTLQTRPQGSQERNMAIQNLQKVSSQFRTWMREKNQQREAGQQNGIRPPMQGQQAQPAQQPMQGQQQPMQAPPAQGAAAAQNAVNPAQGQFSEKVVKKVKDFQFAVPAAVQAKGQQVIAKYLTDARQKYAKCLHQYEVTHDNIMKLEKMVHERKQKTPLTPQEEQQYQQRKGTMEKQREDARVMVQKFVEQQNQVRKENTAAGQPNLPGDQMKREPSQNGGMPINTTQGQPGQAHTVSSALDAARSLSNASETAKANNTATAPNPQAMANQANNAQKTTQSQTPQTQPPQGVKVEDRPPDQRSNVSQPPAPSQPQPAGQAYPLSHEAAMQQARSYSNPNIQPPYQQGGPPGSTHSHPQPQKMGGSNDQQQQQQQQQQQHQPQTGGQPHQKMNIPKDLQIPPPQPVPMPQSRPTLTNGPMPSGPIGQPAIIKHPGFVLEGEGERVLSKKKLEELVRQVTGSTGSEGGDDGETMTAEVEETLLQAADDFVDQVIVSACKLAKLRSSSTLDLRDIQLILERNYNIRVPGYASDEVRAVRKTVPTTGWTQKLSAVQAAKVTAGKRD